MWSMFSNAVMLIALATERTAWPSNWKMPDICLRLRTSKTALSFNGKSYNLPAVTQLASG